MDKPAVKECIANTTVISNFSFVGGLEVLEKLFSVVYITPEVREEIIRGLQEGYPFLESALKQIKISRGWLRLVAFETEEEQANYYQFCIKLHSGEASCLAIAKNRNWLLLTDDQAARKLAKSSRMELSGTIGILALAAKQEIISVAEADDLLAGMVKGNYRSPVASISELLESLGEEG
ncbi:hypothetical protein A2V82_02050 [candidate division KSB1 bacterium RBG_16_48_16]|nr:MAG: hypothetical protein A2V82_02050 [candidate division KSB1 bacterium RBG_16_48_16]